MSGEYKYPASSQAHITKVNSSAPQRSDYLTGENYERLTVNPLGDHQYETVLLENCEESANYENW